VGPVCETTDSLAHGYPLPPLAPGDQVALLTAGAYGFVMASNYNARPRPPEVIVSADGQSWQIARRRETWEDLIAHER
jgi:diaminopimelate decarboxylase